MSGGADKPGYVMPGMAVGPYTVEGQIGSGGYSNQPTPYTWTLPEAVPFGDAQLKPLRGGDTLAWKLV